MSTESILLNSCAVASILILWFKTDAFIEYVRFFYLEDFLGLGEYSEKQKVVPELSFPMHLSNNQNSFLSKLLSCYLCTGFWLSVLFSALDRIILAPVVFIISVFIYKLYEKLNRI